MNFEGFSDTYDFEEETGPSTRMWAPIILHLNRDPAPPCTHSAPLHTPPALEPDGLLLWP
jgi:hypothetical protein